MRVRSAKLDSGRTKVNYRGEFTGDLTILVAPGLSGSLASTFVEEMDSGPESKKDALRDAVSG